MKDTLGKWVRSKKLRRVFAGIAGEDRLIDASEFQRALKIKNEYFADKALRFSIQIAVATLTRKNS